MEKEQTILIENNIKLLSGSHDRPKRFFQWSILALQHVFTMFGLTVLIPLIINQTAGVEVMNIATAFFCSGVGTLIYIAITAEKVLMYLGSSFAYMGVMGGMLSFMWQCGFYCRNDCWCYLYHFWSIIIFYW